jgi:hypothetical protein
MGGNDFEVEREGVPRLEVRAIRNREKQRLQCNPDADIKPGDWLIAKPSGNRIYIYDIEIVGEGSSLKSLAAYYETEEEYRDKNRESRPGDTYNINEAHGSLIGSQQDFIFNASFNFGDLREQIEKLGGSDRTELHQMADEIREQMERGDAIEVRGLAKFSELINRHGWIAGPLANLLLLYSITGNVGG